MLVLIAGFLASALAVFLAGTVIARNGDIIAARTRLGGLWVGSVFVAVATSVPELATDVSAVRMGEVDLAAGDLFGSSMANMLILALVSTLSREDSIFRRVTLDHALYASLAVVMSSIAAMFILFRSPVSLFGIGPGSLLLLLAYLLAGRAIFKHSALAREAVKTEEMGGPKDDEATERDGPPLRGAIVRFVIAAVVVLIAAPVFALTAARLAEVTGLGTTFFGTVLVGLATSLPELVTSLAAIRLGAYDLAVGNLFGSNALNMAMFVPLDLVNTSGPILAQLSETHVISALLGVVLMGTALGALVYRAKRRRQFPDISTVAMLVVYFGGLVLLYFHTSRT